MYARATQVHPRARALRTRRSYSSGTIGLARQDWMDWLNDAVLACGTLVALITPKYGQTQWTR